MYRSLSFIVPNFVAAKLTHCASFVLTVLSYTRHPILSLTPHHSLQALGS